MHTIAVILGALLNLYGGLCLCVAGYAIWHGPRGTVAGEAYAYPSRWAAAFELLPIPLGLSLGPTIILRWGLAG